MSSWSFRPSGSARSVDVRIERGSLARGTVLASLPRASRGLLIHDAVLGAQLPALERALRHRVDELAPSLALVASEATKDVARLPELWRALAGRDLDRRDVVVVAGGGTVLDVAIFLAATWLRGVALVVVPTTLLAQVDAGLGGKCGVNLDGAKNQVGTVYQPHGIEVDPELLETLPEEAWHSGLGEVVKTAALAGGSLFDAVTAFARAPAPTSTALDPIVEGCLRFKAAVVAEDATDRGRRAILNLGHTVAHVLEGLAVARGRELPHGLAVAAGLVAETEHLAHRPALARRLEELLAAFGLPARLELGSDAAAATHLLRRDKKRAADRWIVPVLRDVGDVTLEERDAAALLTAIEAAAS